MPGAFKAWQSSKFAQAVLQNESQAAVPLTVSHIGKPRKRASNDIYSLHLVLDASLDVVSAALYETLFKSGPEKSTDGKGDILGPPPPAETEWRREWECLGGHETEDTGISKNLTSWNRKLLQYAFSLGCLPLADGDVSTEPMVSDSVGLFSVTRKNGAISDIRTIATDNHMQRHFQSTICVTSKDAGGRSCSVVCDWELLAYGTMTECYRRIVSISDFSLTSDEDLLKRIDNDVRSRCCLMAPWLLEAETCSWLATHGFRAVQLWRCIGSHGPEWLASSTYVRCIRYGAQLSRNADIPTGSELGLRCAELEVILPRKNPVDPSTRTSQFLDGDVIVTSFAALLTHVCSYLRNGIDPFHHFVDLGSGRGHAVITAHHVLPFLRCTGIELLREMFLEAEYCKKRYIDSGLASRAKSSCVEPVFIQDDFLKYDWSDASVVFCDAVTWPEQIIHHVGALARQLQPGALLLMAGRRLPAQLFKGFELCVEFCDVSFDQYQCNVWVHRCPV
eukprot:gnl/MRDRNA2_/MRDRNA2_15506_c0_seq1.p1 gnl/MRDRNA2_/MRDRNA2_15506_c0~~gnl/MRDRNA2_/MRDRNA2_15506_c0_seq1.p1  ORF type:complete len:506 (-),score=71.13 gnl/MRDRNA2_/MRDRNA2_15506_c0_seq1:42-1559(-)